MYLPFVLNSPALMGGFLGHFMTRRSEWAGGALGGVFGGGGLRALQAQPTSDALRQG
jgi:hypothetical protein